MLTSATEEKAAAERERRRLRLALHEITEMAKAKVKTLEQEIES